MKRRILVTGGAGYVGYALVKALAQRDDVGEVVVLDTLTRGDVGFFVGGPLGSVPVTFRKVDILDGYGIDEALRGVDTVYHLAANVTTESTDQRTHAYDQINQWGTANLARSIDKTDSVNHVVYVSTFAVYGSHPQPVSEETVPTPSNAYGISKLHGENQIIRLTPTRDVWVVRAANSFGVAPAMRLDTMVNKMAFDAVTCRKIRIDGDGTQTRPIIDITSLAEVLSELPTSPVPRGTYNVAAHNVSVNEIAALLATLLPDLDLMYVSRDVRLQQIALELPSIIEDHITIDRDPLPIAIEQTARAFESVLGSNAPAPQLT